MSARLWEYAGYWIGSAHGTETLYAYWYDDGRRQTRRRSLGTKILEDAKERLITLAGATRTDTTRSPDRVMLLVALDHYYDNDVSGKPSAEQAFRAITILKEYLSAKLLPTAPVSAFGPLRQREFMTWCRDQYKHSANTIARNLSVISAAFRFGKRVVVIRDGFGNEQEVQLLDMAPDVVTQAKRVAELINLPAPTPREWLPTFEEFGRFIDGIDKRKENLFRFVILALNTWARPDTIIHFHDTPEMVNRRFGTLDLNPPGRRQTIKYRPKIRLTANLRGWLDEWNSEAPMTWDGEPITTIKRTFRTHAADCHLPDFSPGTIRHFMATMVRREKPPVSKEQRDVWLGHDEKRTANAYESFDPDYLTECMQATDSVIAKLQERTTRRLSTCKERARPEFKVVSGGRG
ncbi:hypothetical protein ASD64_05635 [Mesorhizobium sp. Root157]|uniref:hypothetical protein n=1 Tax=Mesorhizobium sp. Root157 TaxID=1736477 RepID=UPI000712EDEB|nr:hypothetical protein [Mesorhizobium sp. Root157]KQZ86946.1 hypothetical protein ASD64_05635 [Mesorhizobium sp. Root157]